MDRRDPALFFAVALLAACRREPSPPVPAPAPAVAAPLAQDARALDAARAAAGRLGQTLRQRLTAAMSQGGPAAAARVCSTEAQTIAATIARESGVRVGRSSLRLRNPANDGPAWVTDWLRAQGERPAAGVTGIERVEGSVARVLRPIPLEGVCVTCHGPADQIPAEVREVLSAAYPRDRATGYQPGDLRGALWAEVALGPGR